LRKEAPLPTEKEFYPWAQEIQRRLPALSAAQAAALASWTLGALLARSVCLSAVACVLARLRGQKDNTVRQRLREWYYEAKAKRGAGRTEVDPGSCFGPLLRWVVDRWPPDGPRRLALAIDPTTLGDRFTVLCVSVVYHGCALPVAWVVLAGNTPGAWNPHWHRLLGLLKEQVPALADWQVVVLGDRGLESAELFGAIVALGWHPLLRLKRVGGFRPAGWHKFHPLASFAATPGASLAVRGQAYAKHRLEATLLARWEAGHDEPWLLLTDLPPEAVQAAWYGYRAWIEHSFKLLKSAGWQWQKTRLQNEARVSRQWLVLAVGTLWLVQAGGSGAEGVPAETVALPAARQHSLFRRGAAAIVAAWKRGELLLGQLVAMTWPEPLTDLPPLPPEPTDGAYLPQ
jgi:hypothetical protein